MHVLEKKTDISTRTDLIQAERAAFKGFITSVATPLKGRKETELYKNALKVKNVRVLGFTSSAVGSGVAHLLLLNLSHVLHTSQHFKVCNRDTFSSMTHRLMERARAVQELTLKGF